MRQVRRRMIYEQQSPVDCHADTSAAHGIYGVTGAHLEIHRLLTLPSVSHPLHGGSRTHRKRVGQRRVKSLRKTASVAPVTASPAERIVRTVMLNEEIIVTEVIYIKVELPVSISVSLPFRFQRHLGDVQSPVERLRANDRRRWLL